MINSMSRNLMLAGLCLLLFACGETETKREVIRTVKVANVESSTEIKKDFSGVVEAVEYVKLAFRVSGQIVELPVIEGQKVKKGDLIAKIDPREISLQYAADKASYETASAQLDRNKRLLEKQAVSKQDYEVCVANYEKAKSAYDLSTNNMNDTYLVAPFNGSIERRYVENFQRVNSGEGIVQLVNTNKLRIKFIMPDSYLYLLKNKNHSFSVEFDMFKGRKFNAQIEEYLDISTNRAGIPVSVIIDDAKFDRNVYEIKPGFTCNIHLNSDISSYVQDNMMVIPLSAVFEEAAGSQKYVWVIENGKVVKRTIRMESPTGNAHAYISEGVKVGETVVTAGVHQLKDGEAVKILKK